MANPVTAQYPGAIASDQTLTVAKDLVSTTLTADINATQLTWPVADGSGFVQDQLIRCGTEVCQVFSQGPTSVVVRARGRTSSGATGTGSLHLTGAAVEGTVEEYTMNSIAAEVKAIETSLGLNGVVPGSRTVNGHALSANVTVAYSELASIPSTFAPSAHHAAHQHGGADEIATASPGANSIPKAGSGGQLATGWIPTSGLNFFGLVVNQASNGTIALYGSRATDSSPTGNLIEFKNFAQTVDLFRVDINGQLISPVAVDPTLNGTTTVNGTPGGEVDIIISKTGAISSTNIAYYWSHRPNNQDFFFFSNDGAGTFKNWIKCHYSAGAIGFIVPASSPSSVMTASEISFYLDEATNTLKVVAKYSDGTTVKVGSITLS